MDRTLIFDGACSFCTAAVQWALARSREPFAAVPYQAAAIDHYGLTIDQARASVWWIEGNLQLDGHRAVAEVLRHCRSPWPSVGRALRIPPISWAASAGYRLVSRLRHRIPGARPAIEGAWDPYDGRPLGHEPPRAQA